MRKIIAVTGFLLFILGLSMVHNPALGAGSADSGLFAKQPRFEFLPVFEGQTVRHEFVLQNKGTAVIKIAGVKTD